MKRFTLPIAVAALMLGTAFVPAQPVEAKSIGEMLESAYNAVRRQTNPTTGYGNVYGNFYGYPYGYPYATTPPTTTSTPWLSSFTNRYLGTGTTGQYMYDPYTGQYIVNPAYTNTNPSLGSRVRGYLVREVINRVF
jgi:hypothetical protein